VLVLGTCLALEALKSGNAGARFESQSIFGTTHTKSHGIHGEAPRAVAIAGTNLARPVIPKNSVVPVVLRLLRAEILIFADPITCPSIMDSRP
jgi:hypothetical protein